MRRVWLSLGLVAAVAVFAVSVALAAGQHRDPRPAGSGMMGGPNAGWTATGPRMMGGGTVMGGAMMGGAGGMVGTLWLSGDGTPIGSLAAARDRAATAAAGAGLRPGEVIWFDNGFYVELKDRAGNSATEVIVDTNTGSVRTEPGPAMMWNTRYGMHRAAAGAPAVTAAQAQHIAAAWLSANRPGRTVGPPDAYPGYYTMETTVGGTVEGMLSVNATTGQVWYHTWHGRFIARQDS